MKDYIVTIECFVNCKDRESAFDEAIKLIKNDEDKYFEMKDMLDNSKRKCLICGGMGWQLSASKVDECSNCGSYEDHLTGSEYIAEEYFEEWCEKEKERMRQYQEENKQNDLSFLSDDEKLAELDKL